MGSWENYFGLVSWQNIQDNFKFHVGTSKNENTD